MTSERRAITGIAMRWSHLIIALVVYLLTIGTIYGTMRSQLDENNRRLKELEDKALVRDQFNEFRDDVLDRLKRIEANQDTKKVQ